MGVIGIVGLLFLSSYPKRTRLPGIEKFSDLGNRHIESVGSIHESYNSNPPTSGPHVGKISPWGISEEIIPDEVQVHNLEDGGIIVQYHPDKLPKDEWNHLEDTVMRIGRRHVIIAPRYDMDHTVALTAWRHLLSLESVDEERIRSFIETYEGIDHHRRL